MTLSKSENEVKIIFRKDFLSDWDSFFARELVQEAVEDDFGFGEKIWHRSLHSVFRAVVSFGGSVVADVVVVVAEKRVVEGEDSCARITTVDHRRDVVVSGAGPLASWVGARGVGVVLEPAESLFGDGEHGNGRAPRQIVESGAHDRLELVEGGHELGGWRCDDFIQNFDVDDWLFGLEHFRAGVADVEILHEDVGRFFGQSLEDLFRVGISSSSLAIWQELAPVGD